MVDEIGVNNPRALAIRAVDLARQLEGELAVARAAIDGMIAMLPEPQPWRMRKGSVASSPSSAAPASKCKDERECTMQPWCRVTKQCYEDVAARDESSPSPAERECETCNGDPAVCATVPGLRHCEAATATKDVRIVQTVDSCKDCPHHRYYSANMYECDKAGRMFDTSGKQHRIPDWCPLAHFPASSPSSSIAASSDAHDEGTQEGLAEIARTPCNYGIYVASRVKHAAMWKNYRDEGGVPIISTWIDEAGEGETPDLGQLWVRLIREIAGCNALVFYAAGVEDFPFKGAFVEVGIALAFGKPVYVNLNNVALEGRTLRPMGSWLKHPNVKLFEELDDALITATFFPSRIASATTGGTRADIIEECAKLLDAEAAACQPGSPAEGQNWPLAIQSCAAKVRKLKGETHG